MLWFGALNQPQAVGKQEALAWEQWPLAESGEAHPASSPPSFPPFLLGPGNNLLLLSGEEYPKWL